MATAPGRWTWVSGLTPRDAGLNGKTGSFEATAWSEADKQANPNRRGCVRATANGHALSYADGTPFFLLADTWWSAGTRIWSWGSAAEQACQAPPDLPAAVRSGELAGGLASPSSCRTRA